MIERFLRSQRKTVRAKYSIEDVEKVEFYKLDQLTTDLICCEISLHRGDVFVFHEEMSFWDEKLNRLSNLTGFDAAWFGKVSQPPFASSNYIAFLANS